MEAVGFEELDPAELEIDPLNERVSNTGLHTKEDTALKNSIEQHGIIDSIVVRKKHGEHYVVAGQRRTLAAREVGVDSIPARIMKMNDQEAKLVSITENADQFDKDVPAADRAEVIDSLLEDGVGVDEISEQMGVTKQTVERWWEPARDYWKDTVFEADSNDDDSPLERLPQTAMPIIRKNTESRDQRERVAIKIIENNINVKLIQEAKEKSSSPTDFEQEIDRISRDLKQGTHRIRKEVCFRRENAERLEELMRNRGVGEREIIETLVQERLDQLTNVDDGELLLIYLQEEAISSLEEIAAGSDVHIEALCRNIIREKLSKSGYI